MSITGNISITAKLEGDIRADIEAVNQAFDSKLGYKILTEANIQTVREPGIYAVYPDCTGLPDEFASVKSSIGKMATLIVSPVVNPLDIVDYPVPVGEYYNQYLFVNYEKTRLFGCCVRYVAGDEALAGSGYTYHVPWSEVTENLITKEALDAELNALKDTDNTHEQLFNNHWTAITNLLTSRDKLKSGLETEITERKAANEELTNQLSGKIDKIEGKGLSSNDYTDEEKEIVQSAVREDVIYKAHSVDGYYAWGEALDVVTKVDEKLQDGIITQNDLWDDPTGNNSDPYFTGQLLEEVFYKANKTMIYNMMDIVFLHNVGTDTQNKEYRFGELESLALEIVRVTDIPEDYISSLVFTSGETATMFSTDISDDTRCIMNGDDCEDGIFTPVSNKRYTVIVWFDGLYFMGDVRGVSL